MWTDADRFMVMIIMIIIIIIIINIQSNHNNTNRNTSQGGRAMAVVMVTAMAAEMMVGAAATVLHIWLTSIEFLYRYHFCIREDGNVNISVSSRYVVRILSAAAGLALSCFVCSAPEVGWPHWAIAVLRASIPSERAAHPARAGWRWSS